MFHRLRQLRLMPYLLMLCLLAAQLVVSVHSVGHEFEQREQQVSVLLNEPAPDAPDHQSKLHPSCFICHLAAQFNSSVTSTAVSVSVVVPLYAACWLATSHFTARSQRRPSARDPPHIA